MTTDTNLSQIVFNRLSNEKYHELKTSGQLNDQQFYITPDLDTNPGLIQDYMSNCITKIPQHINLELSTDGTLTLKAGSKVYIPNGVGVFDEVTVNSDISVTEVWNRNGINMLFYNPSNKINSIGIAYTNSDIWSGSNPVINKQYGFWYDTTNNLIRYTTDTGTSWISGFSLPICIVTSNNEIISSVDQIFNGMGYIGAVAFAVPGVQAIIPNGFNKDSKLNNYTATVERVLLKDYAADNILGLNLPLTLTSSPLLSAGDMIYVEEENQMYKASISELNKRTEVEIAKVTTDSTRITSLTPLPIYNRILNSTQVYDFGNDLLEKNITNCITKIPQNIKLEINNGNIVATDTCTVYKGDGSTYTIPTSTNFSHATSAGTFMLIWTGSAARHQNINTCFSGSTAPAQGSFSGSYAAWYDTTNKVIKLTNDGGSTWIGDNSFPLCVYNSTGTSASSIDQVFNLWGKIGDAVFINPGIEFLFSDGFNTDGSYNNLKLTTSKLIVRELTQAEKNLGNVHIVLYSNQSFGFGYGYKVVNNSSERKPSSAGDVSYYYVEDENLTYVFDRTNNEKFVYLGYVDVPNNKLYIRRTIKLPNEQDVPKLRSDNIFTGVNTFETTDRSIKITSKDIDITSIPSSTKYSYIDFFDKNNQRLGVIGTFQFTTGEYGVYLQAGNVASLNLRTNGTNSYTSVATPPASDNSTQIATTAWVRQVAALKDLSNTGLTANRVLITNGSGKVSVSAVTSTELGYLDGVTSSIQTQINSIKQVTGKVIPNPSGVINFPSGSTTPSDGLLVISAYHGGNGSNQLNIQVGGVEIGGYQQHDYDNQSVFFPVARGKVVTFSGADIRFSRFYPYIGA